jgi:hypothetical protein
MHSPMEATLISSPAADREKHRSANLLVQNDDCAQACLSRPAARGRDCIAAGAAILTSIDQPICYFKPKKG